MNYGTAKSAVSFDAALAKEVSSTPDVHQAIDSLSRATEDLHGLIGALNDRLNPVLRPATPDGGVIGTDGYATPLADRIDSQARSVAGAADRVRDFLNRIQI